MTHTLDESAGTIEPGRLHQYLLSRGWRDVGPPASDPTPQIARRLALRFEETEVPLMVPALRALADFERRVAEVITVLSAVERRPESAVVADLLRLCLASTETDLGAPSRRLALQVRTVAWQLLLAASHSALAPPYVPTWRETGFS